MALIQAVKQGHIRGIKLLISNGDTLSLSSNVLGTTALIEACKFDDKETAKKMVKVLLKSGACVNDRDYLGRHAMHWACMEGNAELMNALLSFHRPNEQINLTMTDFEGNSILHYAVKTAKCSFIRHVCKLYERYGVTDWGRNKDGYLAADLALNLGHKHCAVMVRNVTDSDELSYSDRSDGRTPIEEKSSERMRENTEKRTFLELPLIETGKLSITSKGKHKTKDDSPERRLQKTTETNLVPISYNQRKISEEIIGKITYRNLLADMHLIQSMEYSSSYRPGVDESVRLKRMELAAKHVSLPVVSKVSDTQSNKKIKKRTQKDVPHFRPRKKKSKADGNNVKKKREDRKS